MISNIVFSKNRPLQLDAYLESLYKYFPPEFIRTYIIYKVELFDNEYELLFRKYPDCVIVKESDFHSDFLKVISEVDTEYILFGIDDVVYFDSVDFEVVDKTFSEHSGDILGFSLRFGPNAEFLKDSGDVITNLTVAGQKVFRLDWKNGRSPHSRYPFELCSTVYTTDFVRRVISNTMNGNPLIKKLFSPGSGLIRTLGKIMSTRSILKSFGYFFSPNTLESWPCRWCQNQKDRLPQFFYFQKICAWPIQVNMVNISNNNQLQEIELYSVNRLNDKYKQGYRLDIDFIAANKPTGADCGPQYFNLVRANPQKV